MDTFVFVHSWDSFKKVQCYTPSLMYTTVFFSFYTSSIAWASYLNIIATWTPHFPHRHQHALHYICDYVRHVRVQVNSGIEASRTVALRCMRRVLKGASAALINGSLSLSSLQLGVMISSVSSCSVVSALQAISPRYLGLARLAHESYKWVLKDMIAHVCQDTFALMHKTFSRM